MKAATLLRAGTATWWPRLLSPGERADWVRAAVARGRPVILIVGNGAAGNGAAPGNRALGETELPGWWSGARSKGLRLDAAITTDP